jgi:hypothetical protein
MLTRFLPSMLILFSTAMAFAPMPKSKSLHSRLVLHGSRFDEAGHHTSFNPMEGYQPVNEKRAKECAGHFGECSVDEMEFLRDSEFPSSCSSFVVCRLRWTRPYLLRLISIDFFIYLFTDLHKERLQNFMFGGEGNMPKPQALEHRMLEEDLDLQLHLLKEQDHSMHEQ